MSTIWLKAAGIRALKTVAQTASALIIAANVPGILDVGWAGIASAAALAGVISLLTSLAGLPELEPVATMFEPYTSETGDPMVRVTSTNPDGTIAAEEHFTDN